MTTPAAEVPLSVAAAAFLEDPDYAWGASSKAAADGTQKRPYTDPELAALLSAERASPMLRDAMTILALSGMRVEECNSASNFDP
jgi:hypothetical protein